MRSGRPGPRAAEASIPQSDDIRPESTPAAPPRRRHRVRWPWASLSLILVLLTGIVGALALSDKPIRLPVWLVAEAEARVNRMLAVPGGLRPQIAVGAVQIVIERDFVPRLDLDDVRLIGTAGRTVAQLPQVQVGLDKAALLKGQLRPSSLRIIGAQITLKRTEDGRFDLAFGGEIDETGPGSFAELLDRVEAAFASPALSALRKVQAEALVLTLDDRRAGRVWQVGDGRLRLDNRPKELALELGFGLVGGGSAPARASLTFISDKASSAVRITSTVDQVAAADLATQAPALRWLAVVDAPISGSLAVELDAAGHVTTGAGTLAIAKGGLHPTEGSAAIPFDRAGLAFLLDPVAQTVSFSDLSVESTSLRLKASGMIRAPSMGTGLPDSFIGQVQVTDLRVHPAGLFEAPVTFNAGVIEFRLRLNPFSIDVGQISLTEDKSRLVAKGAISADARGWTVGLDVSMNEIRHDRLLALWPLALVPKTREWLVANVQEGLLFNVRGGVRLRPGVDPVVALGYEFAGADVRFLRTLPPIRDGYGYSTLIGTRYTVVLAKGGVTPAMGGRIDASGSVFKVLDITQKPAEAEVMLKTDSSVTAALSLLDEPPFRFLAKAGYPVDIAGGKAITTAVLRMPLRPKIGVNDVAFQVDGQLTDVTSDKLVKGRILRATALHLAADNAGMRISGPGFLGQAPFVATWSQAFGPEAKGRSRVEGEVDISQAVLDEFSVRLPAGAVSGRGKGDLTMEIEKGGGSFKLVSDLRGVALRFAPLALRKDPAGPAEFELLGRLGKPVSIDSVRLASGNVTAEGSVSLREDGRLDVAQFGRVTSGDWLDASVEITGQGSGNPVGVAITGGRLDLRRLPSGAGAGGEGVPIDVTLDTLQVTQGISLTDLRGRFDTARGLDGVFTASVNGKAPVRGAVAPTSSGTAARLQSDDAGAVLAASGIFSTARGGSLDVTLRPRGKPGEYDGDGQISNIQVRDAPVLAELLNAISVIGLLEQLNASGLVFTSANAQFRTSPEGIVIRRGAAVGASLGVSMEGSYSMRSETLNMKGVISPLYLINGIGSVLTKPGEGVFGFNYDLTGSVDDPQVSVNPLSILTPGMLREMFRTDAPTRAQPKRNEFR